MGRLALERRPSRADSRRDVRIERRQRTWNRASRLHLRTGDVSAPDRLWLCAARPDTDDLLKLRRGRLDVGAPPRPSAGARRLVSRCRTGDVPLGPGAELVDDGGRYRVVRVEQAPNPEAFAHVWAELVER